MDTTPTAPGEHTLTTDSLEIRYRVAGRGPLLILHPPGWGIGATPYTTTLNQLENTFTVVYLWPRGAAGLRPPVQNAQLDIPAFVSDLEKLRAHLDARQFFLAGHSHGGLVALHYTLRHPHRVNRLILLSAQLAGVPSPARSTRAPIAETEPPQITEAIRFLAEHGGLNALFTLHTDAEVTAFLGRILPLYFTDPAAMAPLTTALQPLTLPRRTLQEVTASDAHHPLPMDAMAQLDVPTVIVAGLHDRFCPVDQARHLATTLPRAELLEFEHSGHFPWLEEPEAFFARVPEALRRAHADSARY
ncbi:alpha/beta hydrolase [Streptomyces sp. NPDC001537]